MIFFFFFHFKGNLFLKWHNKEKEAIIGSIPSGKGEIIQLGGPQCFLFCDQVALSAHLAGSSGRILSQTGEPRRSLWLHRAEFGSESNKFLHYWGLIKIQQDVESTVWKLSNYFLTKKPKQDKLPKKTKPEWEKPPRSDDSLLKKYFVIPVRHSKDDSQFLYL